MKKSVIFACIAAISMIGGTAYAEGQDVHGASVIHLGEGNVKLGQPLKFVFGKDKFLPDIQYSMTCMISDPSYQARQTPFTLETKMEKARYSETGYDSDIFTIENRNIEPIINMQYTIPKATSMFNVTKFYFPINALDQASLEFTIPAQQGVTPNDVASIDCQVYPLR